MKVNIIKQHHEYPFGEVDVDEDRARYLIGVGVAEILFVDEVPVNSVKGQEWEEKVVKQLTKEKKENKTGNVPTAKKRKK